MSFKFLGLEEVGCTESDVLKAWRRLARENHSDKTGTGDDSSMKALNKAKEQCLESIIEKSYPIREQEFVSHICRVFAQKMASEFDMHPDLEAVGEIIQPILRKFFWIRTVDAMEWILKCCSGDLQFDQTKEDEIPILCRYYNDFIGKDGWSEQDHTMMTVLNKYDVLKAGGYGNFKRLILQA